MILIPFEVNLAYASSDKSEIVTIVRRVEASNHRDAFRQIFNTRDDMKLEQIRQHCHCIITDLENGTQMEAKDLETFLEPWFPRLDTVITKPPTVPSLAATCDGREQDEFEAWARQEKMDMTQHPLHWLFTNEKTNAARQGWKAGLMYATARARELMGEKE